MKVLRKLTAALIALCMLIACACLPAMAETEEDILTAEPWKASADARLRLNPDHTAVWESGVDMEGTWAYADGVMTFTYELYGTRTRDLKLEETDDGWQLTTEEGGVFLPESRADAAAAAANANQNAYPIELGTPIALPFATITLDHAEVTGIVGSNESRHTFNTAADGMKFMALKGTFENTTNIGLKAEYVRGEMVFDDNYTYSLAAKADTVLPSSGTAEDIGKVLPLTSCDYYIYAAIPESLVDSFSTCRVTFAFNDDFATAPNYMGEGDYVFTIEIDENASATAQQGPVRELTYFEECPILPAPTSYADFRESGHRSSSTNGKVNRITYTYQALLPGDSIQALYGQYIAALKDAGYAVSEGSETTVSANGTKLATITRDGNSMTLSIKPGNEKLRDLPTPGTTPAPAPEAKVYRLGDTLSAKNGQVTLESMATTNAVYSDITGTANWYHYYDSQTGDPLLAVLGEFKNTGSVPVDVNNIYAAYIVDGNYSYSADVCGVKKGSSDFIRDVGPMATTKIYAYGEVPASVINNAKSIVLKLGFTDNFGYRNVSSGGLPQFDHCDDVFEVELLAPAAAAPAADTKSAPAASEPVVYTDKDTVKKVQQALNDANYPCGTPDGVAGKKTKAAIKDYQKDHGLTVTGTVTDELLVSMGLAE